MARWLSHDRASFPTQEEAAATAVRGGVRRDTMPCVAHMWSAFLLAAGGATAQQTGATNHLLRLSEGRGLDSECIEPPPPLRGDLSAHRNANKAPKHLKYIGLDGSTFPNESSWTNLGMWSGTNVSSLQAQLDLGFTVLLSMHGSVVENCIWHVNSDVVSTVSGSPRGRFPRREELQQQRRRGGGSTSRDGRCVERMQAWWTGPNATSGGYWNTTIEPLAKSKKILGVYMGDELLGGGIPVSNLTALFDMVKAVWPDGITYYNEEWTPLNDPAWRDPMNESYGVVPASLDWISVSVLFGPALCPLLFALCPLFFAFSLTCTAMSESNTR